MNPKNAITHTGLFGEKAEVLLDLGLFLGNSDPKTKGNCLKIAECDLRGISQEQCYIKRKIEFKVATYSMYEHSDIQPRRSQIDRARDTARKTVGGYYIMRMPDQEACLVEPDGIAEEIKFWWRPIAENILHNLKCFERQVSHYKRFCILMKQSLCCEIGLNVGHHELVYSLPKEEIRIELTPKELQEFIADMQRLIDGKQIDVSKEWLHPNPNIIEIEAMKVKSDEWEKRLTAIAEKCEKVSEDYRKMVDDFWADRCYEVGKLLE